MKKHTILLAFGLLLSLTSFAQTRNKHVNKTQNKQVNKTQSKQATQFKFRRNIQLEAAKKNEEVIISIAEHTKQLQLQIDTSVSAGKVTIEVYDTNDKRQGTYSVGTQLNLENSEHTSGTINTDLLEPEAGNWKVKIIPVNAKGIITIHTQTRM